ncbi:MAG: sigma-70 family RNA polymerase sigma factor [Achromobacter sp.]|uniref:Putative RNA polymerase sigma factor FecI n=1 Tax=Achromobacter insuavis TaxID=1287735 RepID=A0A6J5B5D0_9BURK|nr:MULTISPECIES: sigma-70 family RNA polymerase sigma factor [Achromobacter]MBN9638489.1 sigma-70 family RNA polymerase sigma factor [Achromobacter sp.]CAB3691835.1 putative RNA polymerase sigma factor FecI [Achromobacter insuavis]CUI93340.1 Probable RNA polymerase sigma factor fecI [Achromobacter sp. 2789STDY5608633]CUJ23863.1 Probable RNA polymerase sigma factor fecI [Achromobacter sp. 2789STDY5608628]
MTAANLPTSILKTLYAEHHGWLRSWLRRKLGCPEQAADLAQDTFLRVLTSKTSLAELAEPRAYLTTTASRLVLDRARRERVERAYLEAMSLAAAALPRWAPSPEAVMSAVQAVEQLAAALSTLAPKGREAFLLHYLEDESQPAVAQRLGISVRMVQKYLAQGLLRCHQVVAP